MFRKGKIIFFDESLGKGFIELETDHQHVVFKIEEFSNTSVLPQIGERIKCVVLEQHDELLAKFIVRLDHKNYVAGQNNKHSITGSNEYDEKENTHISRKILKKRRHSERPVLQNSSVEFSKHHLKDHLSERVFALDEKNQIIENIQADKKIIDEDQTIQSSIERIKHDDVQKIQKMNHISETQNLQFSYKVEPSDHQHIETIQNLTVAGQNQTRANQEALELSQDDVHPEKLTTSNDINHEATQLPIETVTEQQSQIIAENILKPQSTIDSHLSPKNQPIEQTQHADEIKIIEKKLTIDSATEDGKSYDENVALNPSSYWAENKRDRQIFDKQLHFSPFQKLMQHMKVKFFYSKRKQSKIRHQSDAKQSFNPWLWVCFGILLLSINFVFYAVDKYRNYQSNNLLKLKQYENAQKEEIKRQKKAAQAR